MAIIYKSILIFLFITAAISLRAEEPTEEPDFSLVLNSSPFYQVDLSLNNNPVKQVPYSKYVELVQMNINESVNDGENQLKACYTHNPEKDKRSLNARNLVRVEVRKKLDPTKKLQFKGLPVAVSISPFSNKFTPGSTTCQTISFWKGEPPAPKVAPALKPIPISQPKTKTAKAPKSTPKKMNSSTPEVVTTFKPAPKMGFETESSPQQMNPQVPNTNGLVNNNADQLNENMDSPSGMDLEAQPQVTEIRQPASSPPIDPSESPPIDPNGNPHIDPSENPPIDPSGNPPIDPNENPIPNPSVDPNDPRDGGIPVVAPPEGGEPSDADQQNNP